MSRPYTTEVQQRYELGMWSYGADAEYKDGQTYNEGNRIWWDESLDVDLSDVLSNAATVEAWIDAAPRWTTRKQFAVIDRGIDSFRQVVCGSSTANVDRWMRSFNRQLGANPALRRLIGGINFDYEPISEGIGRDGKPYYPPENEQRNLVYWMQCLRAAGLEVEVCLGDGGPNGDNQVFDFSLMTPVISWYMLMNYKQETPAWLRMVQDYIAEGIPEVKIVSCYGFYDTYLTTIESDAHYAGFVKALLKNHPRIKGISAWQGWSNTNSSPHNSWLMAGWSNPISYLPPISTPAIRWTKLRTHCLGKNPGTTYWFRPARYGVFPLTLRPSGRRTPFRLATLLRAANSDGR